MEHQFLNVPSKGGGVHRPTIEDDDEDEIDERNNNHYQQQHQQTSPRSIDEFLDLAYHHSNKKSFSPTIPMPLPPHHHHPQNSIHHYHHQLSQFFITLFQNWRYYIIFLALGIANSGDSSEMGCTSYILSSVTFQRDILMKSVGGNGSDYHGEIDHDSNVVGQRSAMIAGAHFAGMLASGLLAGIIADIRGRRYTLLLGLLNNSIVGILSSLVQTTFQLCILRFSTGVGLGFVIAGVVTLSAEISPPCRRGRYMTLVASCYTLGYLYTSLWAILIFHVGSGNWRLFLFVNAVPTMVAAGLVYLFAPESPRYHMCCGRLHEAVQVANFIAARMGYSEDGENVLLTEEELRRYIFQSKQIGMMSFRSKEAILQKDEAAAGGRNHTLGGMGVETGVGDGGDDLLREIWKGLSTIKQVLVKGHWKTTVPLQLSYLALTLITGVATWWTRIFQNLELQTDAFALSFYHTLSQIPGVMIASSLIDSVGRRKLVIVGFGGGSAVLILLSVTAQFIHNSHNDESLGNTHASKGYYTWIILFLANFYTIFLCMGWLAIDCLTAESFPTKVRSTGRGVCVATGRMAGFCVQFLYGPLVNQNRLSYMMGIASVFAAGGILVSYQTTDTTNVDLQDHWGNESESYVGQTTTENGAMPQTKQGQYLSIEQTPSDNMSSRSRKVGQFVRSHV